MASGDASSNDSARRPSGDAPPARDNQPSGGDDSVPSLTAYVIMRAADGSSSLSGRITSDNIADIQPTAEAVDRVGDACVRHGFEVGPFVGVSFAITGPAELFSRCFNLQDDGSLRFDQSEDRSVTELVETVIIDEPAELFGPVDGLDQ